MPKAKSKTSNPPEDEPHGSINPVEAKAHEVALEKIMTTIEEQVGKEDTADLLERALGDVKEALSNLTPSMQLADQTTVMRAIRDKCFNTLLPRSDELDQLLEEIIPNVDIPNAPDVIEEAQRGGVISETDQKVIAEIFESLEIAHDQIATACGLLGRLSRTMRPDQLMTIINASIRPLIQLNALTPIETTPKTQPELPDDQEARVKMMLAPDPMAPLLKKEKTNSATRLLAATYSYKVLNKFGGGITQRQIQEEYQVKAKQLALCLTGKKYLGGSERKAIARKRRASDEPEPSTSTQ